MKPKLHMLIGLPGYGKSTLVNQLLQRNPHSVIASTDNFIDDYARANKITYSDAFNTDGVMTNATHYMNNSVRNAAKQGKDIIWDQTNLTKKSRANKLKQVLKLNSNYEVHAHYFDPNSISEAELRKRLDSRKGKHISNKLIQNMKTQIQKPISDEGFDHIHTY